MSKKLCPMCSSPVKYNRIKSNYVCTKESCGFHTESNWGYPAVWGSHGDVISNPRDVEVDLVDSDGQCLRIRVGGVYNGKKQAKTLGIWISYQEKYYNSNVTGPVLISPETWNEIKTDIDRKLEKYGKMHPIRPV